MNNLIFTQVENVYKNIENIDIKDVYHSYCYIDHRLCTRLLHVTSEGFSEQVVFMTRVRENVSVFTLGLPAK